MQNAIPKLVHAIARCAGEIPRLTIGPADDSIKVTECMNEPPGQAVARLAGADAPAECVLHLRVA